jgi:hypothetical protein
MHDSLEKIPLAALAFLLGTTTTLLVDLARARRARKALALQMAAELRALIAACSTAAQAKLWTSPQVRRLISLLNDRYSKDSQRWTVLPSARAQDLAAIFYVDCAHIADLIDFHERQESKGVPPVPLPIGEGSFEGLIERAHDVLQHLPLSLRQKSVAGHNCDAA